MYHLKSTCYFNEQMEYCPVLVELAYIIINELELPIKLGQHLNECVLVLYLAHQHHCVVDEAKPLVPQP